MKRIYSKPLDKYEEELEKFLNKGVYVPVENQEESFRDLQEAAKRYFELKKSKSITLRVKNDSLAKFKVKAKKSGVPYQRIINTFIDQYANNKIKLAI